VTAPQQRLLITTLAVLACGLFGAAALVLWYSLGHHLHDGSGPLVVLRDAFTRDWPAYLVQGHVARMALDGGLGGAILGCLAAVLADRLRRL
jgi:hypothetical protein